MRGPETRLPEARYTSAVGGVPDPRSVACTMLRVAGEEFLLVEFPLPELVMPLGLTPAEAAIVRHLLEGRDSREIAALRGASVNTVRNQIQSVHRKVGVSNTAELARLCFGSAESGATREG